MQVPFGSCHWYRLPRPSQREPQLGCYTSAHRPSQGCVKTAGWRDVWQEQAPRRRDIPPPTWGNGGVPVQNTCVGTDNFEGLAALDRRPLQVATTEVGLVQLPYGAGSDVTFMPDSQCLKRAMQWDSRRTAISDRYYR